MTLLASPALQSAPALPLAPTVAGENTHTPRVLLIGGTMELRDVVRDALAQTGHDAFDLDCVASLADAMERVRSPGIMVLLVHFELPDSHGIATLDSLARAVPQLPIVVLGEEVGKESFRQAIRSGAQDYLSKGHWDSYTLARALNGAIGRKAVEDALFIEKERAQVTLNSIGDAVLSTDADGSVTYLNKAAQELTGWDDAALGRPIGEVFHVLDSQTREVAPALVERALQSDASQRLPANSVLVRRDGQEADIEDSIAPIHDREGRLTGVVIVFHDVTESHRMSRRISHLAQHDGLTDLPNRLVLGTQLAGAIELARRRRGQLAVLFLDLDNFKHINDSLGHSVGDELLKVIAKRIGACVRTSDVVCRLGGDEFVALLPDIRQAEDAARVAEHMLSEARLPFQFLGHDLHVSVSIGISVFPGDGQDADSLMTNADTAMYHAKASGRDNCQFFSQQMKLRAVERQSIEEDLRHALERSEFRLVFQPKVDMATGRISGAEALIRWQHPVRGLMEPLQFIHIAEDCGLIVPIGQWVLREACVQARVFIDAGLQLDQMAVNVSATEFESRDYVSQLVAILHETGLEPGRLQLELTESSLMRRPEASTTTLVALSDAGVRLAVDDFGTGYSSLSYLKHFPIDTLKIDQSFVRDVASNEDDAGIVRAILAMGGSLRQRVVAEGVETREQYDFLIAHGCAEAQGHFFSEAVPAPALAMLLARNLHAWGAPSPQA
jgi:diguanylate cyclase (GGDEF)-like protein/PAS domain S-box-containing protein